MGLARRYRSATAWAQRQCGGCPAANGRRPVLCIHQILPMDSQALDDSEARVADYLDDKLQTPADLDSLAALLGTITAQHGLLKQQLDAAQRDLHDAKHAAHAHHAALRQRADAFRHDQADMDRRLRVMVASDTSDEAVPRFQAVLDTLHRLDVASGYLELLQDVHVLRYDMAARRAAAQLTPLQQASAIPAAHVQ